MHLSFNMNFWLCIYITLDNILILHPLLCSKVSPPPLHPSHRAPSDYAPEGCRRHFCPSFDTLCSSDLYLCTSTSLFLSPPLCLCPIHFYLIVALAHCPFLSASTHKRLQAHWHKNTCAYTQRKQPRASLSVGERSLILSQGEWACWGIRVGLWVAGGSKDGGHRRVES